MSDAVLPGARRSRRAAPRQTWKTRLLASPGFQSWAARMPLLKRLVRAEGEALFDLVAGFLHSQVLQALIALEVLDHLGEGAATADGLARRSAIPTERMAVLLRAGVALGILKSRRDGRFSLSSRGAALLGVPGLREMVLHHRVLYGDLTDPAAFFRGDTEPDLARFWPYVFGAGAATDPEAAARYSALMADSQGLVAEETLRAVDLRGCRRLMDVGGGTGAFLERALGAYPALHGTLFDLPAVVPEAERRFAAAGLACRVGVVPGSFRDAPLPEGADAISLVRVLYDHADDTVRALLARVRTALAPGGRLIVSEPMTGGRHPTRAGDVYFAIYTMAMETGRARSPQEIAALMAEAGFGEVRHVPTFRPFVTSVVTGVSKS